MISLMQIMLILLLQIVVLEGGKLHTGHLAPAEHCFNGAYTVTLKPYNKCGGFRDCEPGHYCMDGIKYKCPSGTYGETYGLNTSGCSGVCPAGFYCPENTTNPESFPCRSEKEYCPQGSSEPHIAKPGFYTVDSTRFIENGRGLESSYFYRSDVKECEYGYYCHDGIKLACGPGRYGNELRLKDKNCTDECPAGFYCPVGSVYPFTHPCGSAKVFLYISLTYYNACIDFRYLLPFSLFM